MTSANAHARPPALWSFRYSVFIGIQIGMRKFNSMCWLGVDEAFLFWNIFYIYVRTHTHSLKYLILHHRKTWTSNSSNNAKKYEMANALNRDILLWYFLLLFRLPLPWYAIILCVILGGEKHPMHTSIVAMAGCVRPFMFDARIYLLVRFFAACSFIWFLTAHVHLSIMNTVDKHKCLNENNEYGLPIMILWACTLLCTECGTAAQMFFSCRWRMYKILWRWIDTKNTHICTHRGAKLLYVKNKGVLCKQKEQKVHNKFCEQYLVARFWTVNKSYSLQSNMTFDFQNAAKVFFFCYLAPHTFLCDTTVEWLLPACLWLPPYFFSLNII